ncbi:bifunctional 5,10-methylenetetrahydrofolate dehydrogenase/5,10-methenyltetrahydrofolate cyclohydrolase [Paenibacillus tarimensis]
MGKLLQTKELAALMSDSVKSETEKWKARGVQPTLATVIVRGDPASEVYARVKERLARKLGIAFRNISFEADVTEQRLLEEIGKLNADPDIHGIMLELPVPEHIRSGKLADAIVPVKDVDGLSAQNKLACLLGEEGLYPATPQSCIRIAKHFGIPLQGKNVVLIGRGATVGRPLLQLLLRENATVTVCHSHTEDLAVHIARADLLITAAGKAGLVTADMVHPELTVIDAGINEIPEGIVGDVAPDVAEAVRAMTPVPGGVGTLTTVILFENLMKALGFQYLERGGRNERL